LSKVSLPATIDAKHLLAASFEEAIDDHIVLASIRTSATGTELELSRADLNTEKVI